MKDSQFWSLQKLQDMSTHLLQKKNTQFWSNKNGWRYPQTALKISTSVSWTPAGCLAALLASSFKKNSVSACSDVNSDNVVFEYLQAFPKRSVFSDLNAEISV